RLSLGVRFASVERSSVRDDAHAGPPVADRMSKPFKTEDRMTPSLWKCRQPHEKCSCETYANVRQQSGLPGQPRKSAHHYSSYQARRDKSWGVAPDTAVRSCDLDVSPSPAGPPADSPKPLPGPIGGMN